ncbi:hypothetical protein [uncultured Thiodictyon sp.]|uniref:hypothetical protein n=1 Tax=uncultured Thiodictyon sp. TaxID=1846217 RepID=UPI0025D1513E|nr:hypothetical protein [uncultured Thiodictyon sp.]
MSSQGYFPPAEPKRVDWLGVYGTKLPKFAPLIGIGPEEVATTKAMRRPESVT